MNTESKPHYPMCFDNMVINGKDFNYLQHSVEFLLDNSELNPALLRLNAQFLCQGIDKIIL